LDRNGDFADNCNTQMVELEIIDTDESREDISDHMQADEARLKQLIANHYAYTGSELAEEILGDWDSYLTKFVKVTPTDYRHALRVLKKRKAAA